ncbi:MAG: secondary thiamine-phosphate synthase enzyme YjbQ [Thiotrichales bacterium]
MSLFLHQDSVIVETRGRASYDITGQVQRIVAAAEVVVGLAQVFVHHTSASLMLCENADPDVRHDLETFMRNLVPDGDARFRHRDEGPDDMPAHVRSILTGSGLALPVSGGRCALGAWQGVYLWEHRHHPHPRRVTVTVIGNRER